MKLIIITVAFLFITSHLISCSCNLPDTYYPIELFTFSNDSFQIRDDMMVFEGELIEESNTDHFINLTFKVFVERIKV